MRTHKFSKTISSAITKQFFYQTNYITNYAEYGKHFARSFRGNSYI